MANQTSTEVVGEVWDSRRVAFIVSACLTMCLTCSAYAFFAPFFPLHAAAFGLSHAEVGIIFGIFSLAQLLASPLVSPLAALLSRRLVLVAGDVLLACCTLAYGLVPHTESAFWMFAMLRVGQGVGGSLASVCLYAALADAFPLSRGMVTGSAEVSSSLGWAAGPAAGGCLYALGGFSEPFTVMAAMLLLSLLPLLFFWQQGSAISVDTAKVHTPTSKWLLLRHPGLLTVFLSQVTLMTTWSAFDLNFTTWLHATFGFSTLVAGLYFAVAPSGYMALALPCGWMVDRTSRRKSVMALGFLGQALSFSVFTPTVGVGPAGILLAMFANGLSAPACVVPALPDMLTYLEEESADLINWMSSLLITAQALGSTVGPLLGAMIADRIGFAWMLTGVAALDIVAASLLLAADGRRAHRCGAPEQGRLKEALLAA